MAGKERLIIARNENGGIFIENILFIINRFNMIKTVTILPPFWLRWLSCVRSRGRCFLRSPFCRAMPGLDGGERESNRLG